MLPDGRLLALPIPDDASPVRYEAICDTPSIAQLASHLSGRRLYKKGAHLDPDLIAEHRPRHPDWQAVLGQQAAAEGHLVNQGVGRGDLFLFFGLFRAVAYRGRRWRFVPGTHAYHALWGWLWVAEKREVSTALSAVYGEHPHLHGARGRRNALYMAAPRLPWCAGLPGAGCFSHLGIQGRLTDPQARQPSAWRLPRWMYPGSRTPLSYHHRLSRWQLGEDACYLQAAARGQEFVLDTQAYPESQKWLRDLFEMECAGRER